MKNLLIFTFTAALLLSTACSESNDIIEETYKIEATLSFSQTDVWPQRYQILAGAFGADTITPLLFTKVANIGDDMPTTVSLPTTPASAKSFRVYIANQANQPIFTLYQEPISSQTATIQIPNQEIALLSFNRIQKQVFTNCTTCHGGSSGLPAADLNLMPHFSYTNLLDITATNSKKKRVVANSLNESFVIDVIRKKQSNFVHSASNTVATEDIELVEKWISVGAPNN